MIAHLKKVTIFSLLSPFILFAQTPMLTELQESSTDNGASWQVYSKEYGEYNLQNQKTVKLVEIYNGNATPVALGRNLYTYNAQGLVEYDSVQHWYDTYWFGFHRAVYTYTPTNKVAIFKYQNFGPSDNWIDAFKVEYEYDSSDRLLSETTSAYYYETSVWGIPTQKVSYQYNSNGLESVISTEQFSSSSQQLQLAATVEKFYDSASRLVMTHSKAYIDGTSSGELKIYYYYPGASVFASHYLSEYKPVGQSQWVNSSKRDFLYDADDKLWRMIDYNWDADVPGNYRTSHRYTYFYPTLSTGSFRPDAKISVYPNPFIDHLTIKLPNGASGTPFTIYDITGRIITTGMTMGEETHLNNKISNSGIYFVKIGNSNDVIKVIKH